jgi:hypothetical protein
MPHGVFAQGTEVLYNQTKLILRTDGFMHKQSFSVQPPINCHGSVPFPRFALFTHLSPKNLGSLCLVDLCSKTSMRCSKAAQIFSCKTSALSKLVRLSQLGQWLADTIMITSV